MFQSSGYLVLGFLRNCKNIWQNDEVSNSEIENEDLSVAPGLGVEKKILQLGVYRMHLASVNDCVQMICRSGADADCVFSVF